MYCPFYGRIRMGQLKIFIGAHFPCILLLCAASKIIIWRPIFTKWFFSLLLSFFGKALKWSFAKIYISSFFHFLRKMPKTIKNRFLDFSNAICHWMAQNGEKCIQTFFVENFTLFRLIYRFHIPKSYRFWEKCQKPTFSVTVGVR